MNLIEKVKNNPEAKSLIAAANNNLSALRYTEHGFRHMGFVSHNTMKILKELGYDEHTQELGLIAGYLHDVGNAICRKNHGLTGAMLVYPLLQKIGMEQKDIEIIVSAIGNHEEEYGVPINAVGAALIIADKSDAHRTRVHMKDFDKDDIHDRVNYSIKKNIVTINREKKEIASRFYMDNSSSVMDFFRIYFSRIDLSDKAAELLHCSYRLYINDVLINSPKPISAKQISQIVDDADTIILKDENGNKV